MINVIYRSSVIITLLLFLQIFVLNNIHLFGVGTPFVYIYGIISLPMIVHKTVRVLLAFLVGAIIDIFSNSPGIHASATLFVGLLGPYMFKMFAPDNDFEVTEASVKDFGFRPFLYFTLLTTLIHQSVYVIIESGSLFHWQDIAIRVGVSTLLTVSLIFVADAFNHPTNG